MAKYGLLQVYNSDVENQVLIRNFWSLSLVLRDNIVKTYKKIIKDVQFSCLF